MRNLHKDRLSQSGRKFWAAIWFIWTRLILGFVLTFGFGRMAWAGESTPVDTGKVVASLVSSHDGLSSGDDFSIALRTVLDAHWHTYWRNSGDSGEPVYIEWKLPETITPQGELVWPLPSRIATGPIINYGFEGEPLFTQDFKYSGTADTGQITIGADVYYLVCKDVCIPEQASLSFDLALGDTREDILWASQIDLAKAGAPQADSQISSAVSYDGESVKFSFNGIDPNADISDAYFYPYDQGIIAHSEPQTIQTGLLEDGRQGLLISAQPEYLWQEEAPQSLSGVLKYVQDGTPVGKVLALKSGAAVQTGIAPPKTPDQNVTSSVSGLTLFGAIFGAFIGGLILNLMPCVFPVISIKALSIARSAHEEKVQVKREAWIYTAGVVATFLALTVILLAVKAGGAQLGWGFQLQSPKVVGVLAVLLFAIGLNLFGVFELGSRLQNTGAELTQKSGALGSFFTGALAVIVATPCTAPFMAGAIGYALAQPALVTLLVFLFLAIGFALPFLLIAYVPGLLSRLPKPGPWMERFKEILAFPMFAAAIWLVWVLSLQSGAQGVLYVLAAMLSLAFAIWAFKGRNLILRGLGLIAFVLTVFLPVSLTSQATINSPVKHAGSGFVEQAWSPETVETLRAEGRTVFVDFTAAWCVTCKVNERLVLSRAEAKNLFKDTNTAFLVADWTNKNDMIARELAKYGRSGVPLYLVFPPKKAGETGDQKSVRAEILPQVLTQTLLEEAIMRANLP